jgi:hypothetical protein
MKPSSRRLNVELVALAAALLALLLAPIAGAAGPADAPVYHSIAALPVPDQSLASSYVEEVSLSYCVVTSGWSASGTPWTVSRGCDEDDGHGQPKPVARCQSDSSTISCPVGSLMLAGGSGLMVSCSADGGDDSDAAYALWASTCQLWRLGQSPAARP